MQFVHTEALRLIRTVRALIRTVFTDRAMRVHLLLVLVTVLIGFLCWPLTPLQIWLLVISLALIFITELQNTAFEAALDRIHPERHDAIRKSKDVAAAAVLVAGLFYAGVVITVIASHLGNLLLPL